MKKIILLILCLLPLTPNAFGQTLQCEAAGTYKNKELFKIKTLAWDLRVESQGASIIEPTRKGLNKTSLTIRSKDRFVDHFEVELRVIRNGKEIEFAEIKDGSLVSEMKQYTVQKIDYPRTHYRMSLVCRRLFLD